MKALIWRIPKESSVFGLRETIMVAGQDQEAKELMDALRRHLSRGGNVDEPKGTGE